MLAASLPSHSLKSNSNKSVSPQGQDQHRCKSFSLLCLISLEQPPAVCPFSHFSRYLQETSEDTSLWLGLSPIDTGMPEGPAWYMHNPAIKSAKIRSQQWQTSLGESSQPTGMWCRLWNTHCHVPSGRCGCCVSVLMECVMPYTLIQLLLVKKTKKTFRISKAHTDVDDKC